MRKYILFFILGHFFQCVSQTAKFSLDNNENGQISGFIIDCHDLDTIPFCAVMLLNNNLDTVSKSYSGINGFFTFSVPADKYIIKVTYGKWDTILHNIRIDPNKELKLTLCLNICPNANRTGVCPKCKKRDFVIPNQSGNIIYDVFFKSKKRERQYIRKTKRKGYCPAFDENGHEYAYYTYDDIGIDCILWFCKKHKFSF